MPLRRWDAGPAWLAVRTGLAAIGGPPGGGGEPERLERSRNPVAIGGVSGHKRRSLDSITFGTIVSNEVFLACYNGCYNTLAAYGA